VQKARNTRSFFFADELFADPAWDMMLELYASELGQQRVAISDVCIASGVPVTTGLRWLQKLVNNELVERTPDPLDGRRVWVTLSLSGSSAMRRYFDAVTTTSMPI
jgi:DNA-binding MarR family transcriptional regulator